MSGLVSRTPGGKKFGRRAAVSPSSSCKERTGQDCPDPQLLDPLGGLDDPTPHLPPRPFCDWLAIGGTVPPPLIDPNLLAVLVSLITPTPGTGSSSSTAPRLLRRFVLRLLTQSLFGQVRPRGTPFAEATQAGETP